MRTFSVFLVSFFSAVILTPLVMRLARRLKILDHVDEKRKIHNKPMPLLGGLSVFVSFYLALIFSKVNISEPQIKGLIIGSTIIFITGLITDINEPSAQIRLLFHVLASLVIIKSGIVLNFLPRTFWGIIGTWILTIVWVVGITNALNCLDGLDGLAAGMTGISAFCFFVITAVTRQFQVDFIFLALFGSCLGFLIYNISPAKIFLGDAGSTFIGFVLASTAIMGTWAEDNIVRLSIPVLILGVPIFDMVFTTIMRVKNRQVTNLIEWMDYVGKDHFHHRLVDLGLRTKGAVFFIYAVGAILGTSAIVLLNAPWSDALLLVFQAILVFILISVLMVIGKRRRSGWNLKED